MSQYKYRMWRESKKQFDYYFSRNEQQYCLESRLGDIYIGAYNGIELYADDIIEINHKYYLVHAYYSEFYGHKVVSIITVKLTINRNPGLPYAIYISPFGQKQEFKECNFKLIGNYHQRNLLLL